MYTPFCYSDFMKYEFNPEYTLRKGNKSALYVKGRITIFLFFLFDYSRMSSVLIWESGSHDDYSPPLLLRTTYQRANIRNGR